MGPLFTIVCISMFIGHSSKMTVPLITSLVNFLNLVTYDILFVACETLINCCQHLDCQLLIGAIIKQLAKVLAAQMRWITRCYFTQYEFILYNLALVKNLEVLIKRQ